ncbi:protein kinase domain-containing protein [Guyparkeria sp.]|uniref:protein kinase domain-containing protein n=1 Tax=Guyparkeria sp. TaxID=2035736 RepID=UPI003970F22B
MTDGALPERIGRYRIEGVLGEGAMSVIYAGYDPSINRHLAVKCLKDEVARDESYRRRFLTEARAAGTLTHPNIVTIYDVGEADGRPYIAIERLAGDTLANRVAQEGFPPIGVIIELVGQVAAALDFAHRNGVVHQDIKPENIILVEGWSHAKVNDFGVARLHEAPLESDDGMVAGTPSYMSPEQLRGQKTDGRSDLYSLGVMLYWLLAGRLPWEETDVDRLLRKRLETPLPRLTPRDPSTPDVLIEITRGLLRTNPAARYQRGHEVIDDLRHAQRELERLRDDPVATRIIPMRIRWAGILGAVLTLTLLTGLAAVYVKQNEAITGLAVDYGGSLGRTIASEAAEDLLLDDRVAVRALVRDMRQNNQIRHLAIADRDGRVIASGAPEEIGAPLGELPEDSRLALDDDIRSYQGGAGSSAREEGMLLFDVPIRYQSHTVGTLRLGVSDDRLEAANRTTLVSMLAALLVTLVVVLGAAWWLFRRLLTPLDVLRHALLRVARGDTRHRIRLERRDEFGPLFGAFNLMNETLESRQPPSRESEAAGQPDGVDNAEPMPTQVVRPAGSSSETEGRETEQTR